MKSDLDIVGRAFLLLIAMVVAGSLASVDAAVITVTTTIDENDGSCSDGDCSLRDAVNIALAGDSISLQPGQTYLLAIPPGGEDDYFGYDGTVGDLDITRALTIQGNGATISSFGISNRVFHVNGTGNLTLSNLTLTGGQNPLSGGFFVDGIGVHVDGGMIIVSDVSFAGCLTHGLGGGLYFSAGAGVIANSTFSNNRADWGGGMAVDFGASVQVVNSTFSGNQAFDDWGYGIGGAVMTFATLTMTHCTFVSNFHNGGPAYGSAIDVQGGAVVTSVNNLFAGHAVPTTTGTVNHTTSYDHGTSVPSWLGPLANNGGATQTHSLSGSAPPAIDQGSGSQPADQRGFARDSNPDIGSYEYGGAPPGPEMDVQGISVSIADGDTTPSAADDTDFGSLDIAAPPVGHTFAIENSGNVALNLTGSPRVAVSGPHSADFPVVAQPATPIAGGGGTTTFIVNFDPSAVGLRSATVSIANDDSDENPYDFAIQGTGTQQAGTIIVEKQTDPNAAPDSFTFSGDASGSIKDDEQIVVGGLSPGAYTSQETVPPTWVLTNITCDDDNSTVSLPDSRANFQLEAGETVTCTFYNRQLLDFGDAPESYATLLAGDGARHAIVAGFSLGALIDAEPDGQPSAAGDGDDLNPLGWPDDEDGVTVPAPLVPGTAASLTVVGGPSGGMLDGWVDFNADSIFDHPAEHIFGGVSQAVIAGSNQIQVQVPPDAVQGTTYARFRLSSVGSLQPTGYAPDGEVEDYQIATVPVELMRFTVE